MTKPEVWVDDVPFLSFEDAQRVVADSVTDCRTAADARDSERAHDAEDKAWEAALTWISEQGDEQSKALAAEALRSQLFPFERWCS